MLNERRDKVLVVDDDRSRRKLIRLDLESANYWVLEANRLGDSDPIWENDDKVVPSVRQLLESHFFHAAIIDLSLDEKDSKNRTGFEVLTLINSHGEGTKSVILTGYGETQDVREVWKERGACDYLDKGDYSPARIREMVGDGIKQAKLHINALLGTNLTYHELVPEPKMPEVQKRLQFGGEEIRSVVQEAFRPYFPYDSKLREAAFETTTVGEVQHPILAVKLWSRYLDGVVALHVGSREVCDFWTIAVQAGGKKEDIDFVRYEYDPRDRVIGLVEFISAMTIDKFRASISDQQGKY